MNRTLKWVLLGALAIPLVAGIFVIVTEHRFDGGKIASLLDRKIALVRIEGPIYESEKIVNELREFSKDRQIAGIMILVNSPGGAVAPSQEIYAEILRMRSSGTPVAASMGSVAASGGYYIACAAQRVFAMPGTITGSIGVIFQSPRYYKLLDKVGVGFETVKSGRFKDAGNPAREMSVEDRALFQGVIDDTYDQFLGDVCAARSLDPDSLRPVADGRILTGRQALAVRLIDTLGTYQDALAWLRAKAGVSEDAEIIEHKPKVPLLERLLNSGASAMANALQKNSFRSGVYYLSNILQ